MNFKIPNDLKFVFFFLVVTDLQVETKRKLEIFLNKFLPFNLYIDVY